MPNYDKKESDLLKLPPFVQSKEQVGRLIKEILLIEDFLYKGRVRETGSKMSLPKTTSELDELAYDNSLNVLQHNQRMKLAGFLRQVYKEAPIVILQVPHNDKRFIEGIISWLRDNIHAQTLVKININSRLSIGCILRIKHKSFNLALSDRLDAVDLLALLSNNEPSNQKFYMRRGV